MTQLSRVARVLGASGDVRNARLVLSTPTAGGAFASYASVIDASTNDPRTLLPRANGAAVAATSLIPSSARAQGTGGAFYTTDVTIANTGAADATMTLKFLGHDAEGTTGTVKTFALAAGKSVTYTDVLGSVFGVTSGYGAIQIGSSSPSLAVASQTWTPASGGGTFGQSVPAVSVADLAGAGARTILGVREDASFRTNLVLANAGAAPVAVDVSLVDQAGSLLGSTQRVTLPPIGMTQLSRVARVLGATGDVVNARLVLSTSTAGGAFATYASVIDASTNDPRTLLPQ